MVQKVSYETHFDKHYSHMELGLVYSKVINTEPGPVNTSETSVIATTSLLSTPLGLDKLSPNTRGNARAAAKLININYFHSFGHNQFAQGA